MSVSLHYPWDCFRFSSSYSYSVSRRLRSGVCNRLTSLLSHNNCRISLLIFIGTFYSLVTRSNVIFDCFHTKELCRIIFANTELASPSIFLLIFDEARHFFYRSQNMFRVLKSFLRFLCSVVHTKRLFQVLMILRALLMFQPKGLASFFLYFNVTSVFLRTLAFGYSFNSSSNLCLYLRTQSWLL